MNINKTNKENKMNNLTHLIGKEVVGHYGFGIAQDNGKIDSIENGWMIIKWDDNRTHSIHIVEFSQHQNSISPIGIFLKEQA